MDLNAAYKKNREERATEIEFLKNVYGIDQASLELTEIITNRTEQAESAERTGEESYARACRIDLWVCLELAAELEATDAGV